MTHRKAVTANDTANADSPKCTGPCFKVNAAPDLTVLIHEHQNEFLLVVQETGAEDTGRIVPKGTPASAAIARLFALSDMLGRVEDITYAEFSAAADKVPNERAYVLTAGPDETDLNADFPIVPPSKEYDN